MNTTIEDVAKKAGVSKSTVSRIINNVPKCASTITIKKVQQAIDELGYMHNALAASLKTNRTKTIGLIIGDVENPFYGTVVKGIETTLQNSGYSLILANSGYTEEKTIALAKLLIERQIDALIIAPSGENPKKILSIFQNRQIHFVVIDSWIKDMEIDQIVVDNYEASYNAANYLIDLGHRHLATITGPITRPTSLLRLEGFISAMKNKGIDINTNYIKEGDYRLESGYESIKSLLKLDPRPTAIFISNNLMTMGALGAIHESGLNIPMDISILGFDDMYWYTMTKPTITAINQPAFDIGKTAAERILIRLRRERQPAPLTIKLKTDLIIRESTSPPMGKLLR